MFHKLARDKIGPATQNAASQAMIHQAVILVLGRGKNTQTTEQNRYLYLGISLLCFLTQIGEVCPTRSGIFRVTEAGHANLCRVVTDSFRVEQPPIPRPSEQPRREVQRPLAQRRPSAALENIPRPSPPLFLIPLHLRRYMSINQMTNSFGPSVAVAPLLLLAWGFVEAPAHPKDPWSNIP